MAHTPLFSRLRARVRDSRLAARLRIPIEAVREKRARELDRFLRNGGPPISRRQLVTGAAALGAASALHCGSPSKEPTIAIIGGGISGLTAALLLQDAGYRSTIYEALPARVGGRMRTERVALPGCGDCHAVIAAPSFRWRDDQTTDIFAELIDTSHETILSLADRFGLEVVDNFAYEPVGATETYYVGGSYYDNEEADADFVELWPALQEDLEAAGYPTTWESSTPEGRELDDMSVYDWIGSRVPGGHDAPLGKLLDIAYTIEYGAETIDQSALGLVYLAGYGDGDRVQVFGPSDERYRIGGGVERLPEAIGRAIGEDNIRLGWFMESIRSRGSGYELSFSADRTRVVRADYVLLALPFSALRKIDYQDAGFDEIKVQAIEELGAGRNAKLHLQFDSRFWEREDAWGLSGGSSYSDTGYFAGWAPSRGQAGECGLLAKYIGGAQVDALKQQHPYANSNHATVREDALAFLAEIEPVFPGVSAEWNGLAQGTVAHRNPFWGSSYSYWRKGQAQAFGGYEGVRQGNVFFCGEHTSLDFQGFMEGAAASAVVAADEMIAALRGEG